MLMSKNINLGKNSNRLLASIFLLFIVSNISCADDLEGNFTSIKVLDKISSKNILVNLKNGDKIQSLMIIQKSLPIFKLRI
mgnify:CR=1 FL=1